MEIFDCEVVVIGGGVIGLAVARTLQLVGRDVILLEKNHSFGCEVSSRNSEVIHAGIYYAPLSLKAIHCVAGKELIYDYCKKRHIPYSRLGKYIVATHEEEVAQLEAYLSVGAMNGVSDLCRVSMSQLRVAEPEVKAVDAIFSPSTGIIDSHAFMLSLLGDFQNAGGISIFNTPVLSGVAEDDGVRLMLGDVERSQTKSKYVINCAGLTACSVAKSIFGIQQAVIPTPYYALGRYFVLGGSSPFSHLVYPVAGAGHLGVHVTLDLSGQVRFGPDINWISDIDYSDEKLDKQRFIDAVARYFPGIHKRSITFGYSGIRPKISGPTDIPADFVIQSVDQHGIPGLINFFGIESPGLTGALSLAEAVHNLM